jgi:phage shock protein A
MSTEDPTKNLPGADTTPTLEGIIHRIDRLGALVLERFDQIDARLEGIDSRLDRIEARTLELRADVRDLRGEWKEFRSHMKEPA